MEQIELEYRAKRNVSQRAHVGVVGSGELEVLLEPGEGARSHVFIRTSVHGFRETWKAVLDRFFAKYDGVVRIQINDAGGTPGSVMLISAGNSRRTDRGHRRRSQQAGRSSQSTRIGGSARDAKGLHLRTRQARRTMEGGLDVRNGRHHPAVTRLKGLKKTESRETDQLLSTCSV